MSDPSRLLVVRHGQSTWNAEGRWQGTENPPLSTLGVRQARHAAQQLGTFDAVVASDLERAFVTATILAEELGIGPVQTDADLRERSAGEYQGLTRHEIEERFPGYLAEGLRPPGWEEDDVVLERAAGALGRVALAVGPGGTALVVTHGGVIHTLERALGLRREQRLANLGGRWFTVGPGHFGGGDDVLLVTEDEVTVPNQL